MNTNVSPSAAAQHIDRILRGEDYVGRKINHLKRTGLIGAGKTGYGQNGGACPDWLITVQKEEEKRLDLALQRALRSRSRQPDIDWFEPARASRVAA